MEGPSLVIAAEQLAALKQQPIVAVAGNTKVGKERFADQVVLDVFSWGKHLVLQFDNFAARFHFLLWGTYTAQLNGLATGGDYEKRGTPRLSLTFLIGSVNFYNCSIKLYDTDNLRATYDFSKDLLSPQWDPDQAFLALRQLPPQTEIADALLDQEIFAGLGNIMKNETLFLARYNPKTPLSLMNDADLKMLIFEAKRYAHNFYQWRKAYELRKHYQVYRQSVCPVCGTKIVRGKTGKRERISYFCPHCQPVLQA